VPQWTDSGNVMKYKYCLIAWTTLTLLYALSSAAVGQNMAFDPRDLSGIWGGVGGGGGEVPFGPNMPPMTPEGLALYLQNIPTESDDPRVKAASDPALSNDPTFTCNPRGFPRTLYDTNVRLFEIIYLEGRILQLLQRDRTLREMWMDGRALPAGEDLDNIGPSWYGHSVARWQGDELIVTTVGLDERAWLDMTGHVKSPGARVEERYKRVEADTIQHDMTLYDTAYYTEPWVAETRIFKREPPERITYFGWHGLFSGVTDLMCAPMNFIDTLKNREN